LQSITYINNIFFPVTGIKKSNASNILYVVLAIVTTFTNRLPCACAITAIASSDTSLGLPDCNIFIFNTLATAKNHVATANIIFFFILTNLIISNLPAILPAFSLFQCLPALQ
jgi:hypothetical protein